MPHARSLAICLLLPSLVTAGIGANTFAAARIELELITERGFPITGSQQWTAFLQDLHLGRLRIRSGSGRQRPQIETLGTPAAPIYRVTGVLTSRNRLRLPGGVFGLRDKARLKAWMSRLLDGGQDAVTSTRGEYGLIGSQLVAVHKALGHRVQSATQGKRVQQVVAAIAGDLTLPVVIDPSAREPIRRDSVVADQLVGMSSGTALAAVLRPIDLVMVPEKPPGAPVQLRITRANRAPKSWPVGWPLEKKSIDLVPKLFEYLEVEIVDTPLAETLQAIQSRLDVPVLMDHASLARHNLDISQVKVSMTSRRAYYKRILDRILYQARLKAEVRVDEAGQPLIWITTRTP